MIVQASREPALSAEAKYNQGYIWSISLVAALGGLLFGYDWVVISGADPFFERFFPLTRASEKGWAKSCALVGCLLGALVSGGLSDRSGESGCSSCPRSCSRSPPSGPGWPRPSPAFVSWRIIGGVAIGLASNLSPMYIAEDRPRRDARQAGVGEPVDHRDRHPPGATGQLAYRPAHTARAPRPN